ncbi:aminopeptidase P family protein [uncultured Desulfovibrio sp.]|uniref:M24 family metallopeptidase n=1 Tax=uncultured Desulfovibrio sp. TaxID=167968 RepID=UPI00260C70A6|nr:aminopeptidase P family protein [uncultured Desulfovibrio sp.]
MNDIFAARREKLRRAMHARGLDALLVSQAANRFYLSGFELHDPQCNESAGRLVISADGRDWLATDARYRDAAARLWDAERIFIYGGNAAGQLHGLLRRCGSRVGIEAQGVSLAFARALAKAGPGLFIEAADGLVERLRRIKEPCEVAALEKSFALNHRLLQWVEGQLAPGRSEAEISWSIERYFRENGASELAFANIVAVGRNAALPHAVPGGDVITENCPVLIDVGCRVDGYCSDQTRTFWVGHAPADDFRRTLELTRRAQTAAIEGMRPGLPLAEAYALAHAVFERAGVADAFTHGLGHGVGLETHEAPSLSPRSAGVLEPGMVVTVEPGLYYPQWGGVRWEYTVLVEEDGVRIL